MMMTMERDGREEEEEEDQQLEVEMVSSDRLSAWKRILARIHNRTVCACACACALEPCHQGELEVFLAVLAVSLLVVAPTLWIIEEK